MCGIAGFISKPDFDAESIIRQMTLTMTHRGPDDMGCEVLQFGKGYTALGHRRLKIIDLSSLGHQPMANSSGTIYISYNGEVYNYMELKDELTRSGASFVSTSDTEVILKAYEEWGTECFSRFNGMWAIAIFDKSRERLILSRDRMGVKPLYYYRTSTDFVFASEIKAILRHPKIKKEPNLDKIFRYVSRSYRYVDSDDMSFFKDIYQVPKSSFIEIDEALNSETTTYWRLNPNLIRRDIKDEDAVEQFRYIFVDSVRLRLRSDVPVGAMLSGGMDSTSITCAAYKLLKNPIVTFSGVTGDQKGVYDESEYINSVIRDTNADYHYIKPDPADIFETVEEMLGFHDEPICTVTWYSLYLIAKKIKNEGIPVVLNGHAGDELLAGYWDHYHYNFYDLFEDGEVYTMYDEITAWRDNHRRAKDEVNRTIKYITSMKKNRELEPAKFTDYSYLLKKDIVEQYKTVLSQPGQFPDELSRRLYLELLYETVPATLRPEDRNTMSQSIESRSPFLDYRLIEFCFSLPGRLKIRNGLGKWILREAMKGVLPEDVRTRKDKSGFIAPADKWFRTINRDQMYALINSESLKRRDLFDIRQLNRMFEEHVSGMYNHQMILWQIMNLELWFRRFFDE
ncbi:asparagine synthase (glutamine-hydrolyzing) [Candidatus Magnetominusculus xianensis]|uniref:asparagine synthase (glutamine-hydrolyzing) n=1 Tax=Candidatus Magnetominusculus xianensis TaxID=1748249 RepID=A0ABR5SI73_9BACT|nr:asparagine synthase (glutamine-hydrolyzing) [Candidatus Magnetominusculus xianensis]KWT87095.1 asparagine synthetase B [Candidatus Magnetominusculus xianensis]MBF0404981.1 asparagine synthase (glutamine-hydrolyzing) [Nitrospirota bacterium]